MNNCQLLKSAQDIPPPHIERVGFQMPPLREPPLHPCLDFNPSFPGLLDRLPCTLPSEITDGVARVKNKLSLACSRIIM